MARLSLSGAGWRFRDCSQKTWLPATVPGCVHTDLLSAKKLPDLFWGANEEKVQWIEERDWEYQATFTVSKALLADEVLELVADGLDTIAIVMLNGQTVAETENMFVGYRWDVKRLLRPGKNELKIRFNSAMAYMSSHRRNHTPREINDPVGRSTVIRKQQCQFGWDWGPRFVTAGIWRDIRLESWSGNRLESVRIRQDHTRGSSVRLELSAELARLDDATTLRWTVSLGEKVVVSGEGETADISDPQLWWPAGQGAQPLYRVQIDVVSGEGKLIGQWDRRIGLRTIVLDQHPDEWGTSFQLVINGRPIFAKGANWIPAHTFVADLTRADYERDLRFAVDANMNLVRVWGGGIYESEDFYDLCDELGLLVWQDYMFACTLYPADQEFLASTQDEVVYQTRRLRHRACLALWCGNNEVYHCNWQTLDEPANERFRIEYEKLFHKAIPEAKSEEDDVTPYWPSSPWRIDTKQDHASGEIRGDTHFWDVWHARLPVKEYERWNFRFVSEFGMQSYVSPETQATFCEADANVFDAEMENHQKNRGGNQVILDYVSRRYRFPKNQSSLIYLSQLNQAYCMQIGVEHYRRLMPRCMGALYWQLNDCWPVASWSSIEFTGRWKALHYCARRFNAPSLVSAHVPGDETAGISNYRKTTVREVHLYTVHDAPETKRGVLRWDIFHVDGRRLKSGRKKVALTYGESVRQETLDFETLFAKHHRDNLYLRVALDVDGQCVSEETVFLTLPRFVHLPKAPVQVRVKSLSSKEAELTFKSRQLHHRLMFNIDGADFTASDNYFDLYPNESKSIRVQFARPLTNAVLKKKITTLSLADTY
jgi:beta-mannosidase